MLVLGGSAAIMTLRCRLNFRRSELILMTIRMLYPKIIFAVLQAVYFLADFTQIKSRFCVASVK